MAGKSESSHIKHVDDENFESVVGKGVVLVDFFAEWCGPCHMQTPILEVVAQEISGKALVAKLDVDQSQKTTSKFKVTSIPTMILFKNGEEIKRLVGLRDADTLKEIIYGAMA